MALQIIQTPDGVQVIDVTVQQLKIVQIPSTGLPLKGETGLVYDTDDGWMRWDPVLKSYRKVGDGDGDGMANWGAIGGTITQQSDLQQLFTQLFSGLALATNGLATHTANIADLVTRMGKVETAVLPPSSSVPTVGVPTIAGSIVPGGTVTTSVAITGETLPTARQYVYQIGGVQVGVMIGSTNNTFVVPANADTTKQLTVAVVSFNAAGPGTKTSTGYALSAGASVPVISGVPSFSGTPASGSTLTVALPSATNTPTNWRVKIYRVGAVVQNTTQLAAPTYVPGDTEKGLEIMVGVVAINAAGESASEVFSTPIVISGGVAPDYTAAGSIPPGITNAPGGAAGVVLVGDDGVPSVGNIDPRLTTRQWKLKGNPISAALAQSFDTSSYSDSEIQYSVIVRNSVGASAEANTPAYYVS